MCSGQKLWCFQSVSSTQTAATWLVLPSNEHKMRQHTKFNNQTHSNSRQSSQLAELKNQQINCVRQTPVLHHFRTKSSVSYLLFPSFSLLVKSSVHTLLEIFHHPSYLTLDDSIHSSVHHLLLSPQGVWVDPPRGGESRQFARARHFQYVFQYSVSHSM